MDLWCWDRAADAVCTRVRWWCAAVHGDDGGRGRLHAVGFSGPQGYRRLAARAARVRPTTFGGASDMRIFESWG